jgi:hypothetical protein
MSSLSINQRYPVRWRSAAGLRRMRQTSFLALEVVLTQRGHRRLRFVVFLCSGQEALEQLKCIYIYTYNMYIDIYIYMYM